VPSPGVRFEPGLRVRLAKRDTVMKAPNQRQLRAGELVRRAVSELLAEGQIKDPAVIGRTLTITEARMSPDLRYASVFVAAMGEPAGPAVIALNRAGGFIQRAGGVGEGLAGKHRGGDRVTGCGGGETNVHGRLLIGRRERVRNARAAGAGGWRADAWKLAAV